MRTSVDKAERLSGAPPVSDCWIDPPSPEAAEIMAPSRPDFAVVDLGHDPASQDIAGRVTAARDAAAAASLAVAGIPR